MADSVVSSGSSGDDTMIHNLGSPGSTSNDGDRLDHGAIYCVPRDLSTSEAEEAASALKMEGYKVIREDADYIWYAPRDGFPSQAVQAKISKLKSSSVKQEVVRDVSQPSIWCGGVHEFQFGPEVLPLVEGQLGQQTITVGGMLKTLQIKEPDNSDWVRVEITTSQWALNPKMRSDEKYVGYFVESLELKLSPKWERASCSCRHAPKLEEVKTEQTTLQQVEKSGNIQFSASKTPGATIGGGVKKTKGSQEKVMKSQCKERWLVCEDGMKVGSYKWDMFYWQTEGNARHDPKSTRKGVISILPLVPENSMLTNVPATVDWILQVPPPGDKTHQPLEWDVTCTARAVFLTQKEEKRKLLPNVFKIEPKIVQVELGTITIKLELNRPLYYKEIGEVIASLMTGGFRANSDRPLFPTAIVGAMFFHFGSEVADIRDWIHDNIALGGFFVGFGVAMLSMGLKIALWPPAKRLVFRKKSDHDFPFLIGSDGLLVAIRTELLRSW